MIIPRYLINQSIEIDITLVSSVHVANEIVAHFSCIVCYDFGFLRHLFLMVLNMEFYINTITVYFLLKNKCMK